MHGNDEPPPSGDPSDIRRRAWSLEGYRYGNPGLAMSLLRNSSEIDVPETVFNETPAAENSVFPSSSGPNDALFVPGGLLSRGVTSHTEHSGASSSVGNFRAHQDEMAWEAAARTNDSPSMQHLESRLLLQSQMLRQQRLASLTQQSMQGSLDLRQIRFPNNLLLNMQNQLQMDQQHFDQQSLEQQQLQNYQPNQALISNFLPGGFLSQRPASLAMSHLRSYMNPSLLTQDPLASSPPNLAASHPIIPRSIQYTTAASQGTDLYAGGRDSTFPMKLHRILADPRFRDCICWLPNGKSWRVLNQHLFADVALPEYFKHQKYASFMRQVNGWGFKRARQGPEINSYSHELFLRDDPELCSTMRRLKQSSFKGTITQADDT
ncbi:unnamed protein product [Cylindrotheca closterium]|uniref:HSF-type DNA-binding domain-containing protein n=1 Tax=Cylindrotheca closterium TaxID=2856 RepID=A0AAD2CT60_9STRA|nr:unnamed protein product [Cylindrotheca closterium]